MLSLTMCEAASSTLHPVRSLTAFLKAINTVPSQALLSSCLGNFVLSIHEAPTSASGLTAVQSSCCKELFGTSTIDLFRRPKIMGGFLLFIAHEVTPCPQPCFSWFLFLCLVLSFTSSFQMPSCFDGNHDLRKKIVQALSSAPSSYTQYSLKLNNEYLFPQKSI